MELSKCKIGIRPTIDGRWGGIREGLEEQTMGMAKAAKALIEANLTYSDGTPVQVVIADSTIVLVLWFRNDGSRSDNRQGRLGLQRHRAAGRSVSGSRHGGACPEGTAGLLHLWS